jgi:hypothetical protein
LDNADLVRVAAHEFFHWGQRDGAESAAEAYGIKVSEMLCPEGGLFFLEQQRHLARPGDSILMPASDRDRPPEIHIKRRDGTLKWHDRFDKYQLWVSSKPYQIVGPN